MLYSCTHGIGVKRLISACHGNVFSCISCACWPTTIKFSEKVTFLEGRLLYSDIFLAIFSIIRYSELATSLPAHSFSVAVNHVGCNTVTISAYWHVFNKCPVFKKTQYFIIRENINQNTLKFCIYFVFWRRPFDNKFVCSQFLASRMQPYTCRIAIKESGIRSSNTDYWQFLWYNKTAVFCPSPLLLLLLLRPLAVDIATVTVISQLKLSVYAKSGSLWISPSTHPSTDGSSRLTWPRHNIQLQAGCSITAVWNVAGNSHNTDKITVG